MIKAHPLYGRSLIVNITTIIAKHGKAGGELTISIICTKLITQFPDAKIDLKALNKRVRGAINALSQSATIKTEIKKTPDHKLPYIIILT